MGGVGVGDGRGWGVGVGTHSCVIVSSSPGLPGNDRMFVFIVRLLVQKRAQ